MLAKLEPYRKACFDAAEVIRQRGHCKGIVEDARGRVCLLGALNTAVWLEPLPALDRRQHEAVSTAFKALEEYLGSDPVVWNNAPETTQEQVIAALEAVGRGETSK